jgi:hypothetical protein
MKLFDTDPENNIEFLFSKSENLSDVECQMQITKDGKIAITRKAISPVTKFQNLAQWLDSLWDECQPALIEELGLKFEFSHREHIGEGYFYVLVDNRKYLLIYEHLGQSNVAHAKELRDSLDLGTV